jgi:hypothetical protein
MNNIIIIKLIGMAYVTIFHFTIGITISKLIDLLIPNVKKDEKGKPLESTLKTFILMYLNFILIVYAVYIIRNIIEKIPFPLDGVYGYEHSQLKESSSILLTGFFVMYYQTQLRDRIDIILNKFFK